MKVTAKQVLAALELRHSNDIFVPECNLGSANQGCRRIDAWAMPRSWNPFTTIGYEIKVSRSDFLNDDKWREYLGYCHELWFACPWKLIAPEELPDGVGLMWMNKGGTMVRKRKAVRSSVIGDKIIDAMGYILMSRAKIVASQMGTGARAITPEEWQAWLDNKATNHLIGRRVLKAINKRCEDVKLRNAELEGDIKTYEALRRKLKEIGIDPDDTNEWRIEGQIDKLRGIVSNGTIGRVQRASAQLASLAEDLIELRGGEIER